METQLKKIDSTFDECALEQVHADGNGAALTSLSNDDVVNVFEKMFNYLVQQNKQPDLSDLLSRLTTPAGKSSFLVFKHNKYVTVPTENIAFFYLRHESTVMMCFDKQEYLLNHSLEHVQNLLSDKQFFRLNRQYLINFRAVKEVEHYFARKLFVQPIVPAPDKLLVSKEKVSSFLTWMEDR